RHNHARRNNQQQRLPGVIARSHWFGSSAAAIVGLALLAGCSDSGSETITFLDACELATKAAIENPSTYQRAAYQDDAAAIIQLQYDHENAFGAVVRGYARCQFDEVVEGQPRLVDFSVNGNDDPVLLEIGQEAIDISG
ncbi:MAG: hypothetical protein ACTSWI_01155, partial [Alphaproteobacteria bacterium]